MQNVPLRDAKAKLSALIDGATRGQTAIITRHGKPSAVLLGVEEWDRLRRVPTLGQLLLASPLEEGDVPPRDRTPPREVSF